MHSRQEFCHQFWGWFWKQHLLVRSTREDNHGKSERDPLEDFLFIYSCFVQQKVQHFRNKKKPMFSSSMIAFLLIFFKLTLDMNIPGSSTPNGWLVWSVPPTILRPSGPPALAIVTLWKETSSFSTPIHNGKKHKSFQIPAKHFQPQNYLSKTILFSRADFPEKVASPNQLPSSHHSERLSRHTPVTRPSNGPTSVTICSRQ